MTKKQVVYTERCSDGVTCSWMGSPAYIPDGGVVCDSCLLERYSIYGRSVPNVCLDPLGMENYYKEKDVVKALRMAAGL